MVPSRWLSDSMALPSCSRYLPPLPHRPPRPSTPACTLFRDFISLPEFSCFPRLSPPSLRSLSCSSALRCVARRRSGPPASPFPRVSPRSLLLTNICSSFPPFPHLRLFFRRRAAPALGQRHTDWATCHVRTVTPRCCRQRRRAACRQAPRWRLPTVPTGQRLRRRRWRQRQQQKPPLRTLPTLRVPLRLRLLRLPRPPSWPAPLPPRHPRRRCPGGVGRPPFAPRRQHPPPFLRRTWLEWAEHLPRRCRPRPLALPTPPPPPPP